MLKAVSTDWMNRNDRDIVEVSPLKTPAQCTAAPRLSISTWIFFFPEAKQKIFSLLFHSLQRIHLVKKEQKEKQ